MKKLLIIGNDFSVIQALVGICSRFGFKEENIKSCGHKEALEVFYRENPSHIIILEYDESRRNEGTDTWLRFLEHGFLREVQEVILYGHKNYNLSNYRTFPIEPLELRQDLVGY